MYVNEWISYECPDEGTRTPNIRNSSTRSHASEEENRTRIEIELLAGEVFDGILILYTCVGVRLEKEGRPSFKNMSVF